jgi:hypothetical protein
MELASTSFYYLLNNEPRIINSYLSPKNVSSRAVGYIIMFIAKLETLITYQNKSDEISRMQAYMEKRNKARLESIRRRKNSALGRLLEYGENKICLINTFKIT